MKRILHIISAGLVIGAVLLTGCSGGGKVEHKTTENQTDGITVNLVDDLITGNEGEDFVTYVDTMLDNFAATGLDIYRASADYSNGKFNYDSLSNKADYSVIVLGSGAKGTEGYSDRTAMTEAYQKVIEDMAAANPTAPIICAYDMYDNICEAAIADAIAGTGVEASVYSLNMNDYDDYLDRSRLADVHELLATYLTRQLDGLHSIVGLDPSKPVIALTFDDGPNTTTSNQVMDVLEQYGITASFFLIGNNIDYTTTSVVEREAELGYEINSHSNMHSYMNKMTAEEIEADMTACTNKIQNAAGVKPKFFRPPYIAVNTTMFENINMPFISGYGCNDWDASVDTQTRIDSVLANASDGEIILLHDAAGNDQTVEALPAIIEGLQEQGYQFVTVTQLFAMKNVVPTTNMVYSNATQTSMY